MFDWHDFFCALLLFSGIIFFVLLLAFGFYLLCEVGNVWGFALIVGTLVLGGSIAIGFGL